MSLATPARLDVLPCGSCGVIILEKGPLVSWSRYFEYHFNHDGHNFGWGTGDLGGRDVDTAINLMLRLREAGIRSHFWI